LHIAEETISIAEATMKDLIVSLFIMLPYDIVRLLWQIGNFILPLRRSFFRELPSESYKWNTIVVAYLERAHNNSGSWNDTVEI
jgi:hypothetical protein